MNGWILYNIYIGTFDFVVLLAHQNVLCLEIVGLKVLTQVYLYWFEEFSAHSQ